MSSRRSVSSAREVRVSVALVLLVWLAACDGPPSTPAWPAQCDRRGLVSELFVDVTAESGLSFVNFSPDFRGGAVAVADVTGDGLLDVVAGGRHGALALFENRGALTFADITEEAGLPATIPVTALATADMDNDGDVDLLVAERGLGSLVSLYANDGTGRFSLTTALLNTGAVEHLLPVDVDGDGLLDVHTSNYAPNLGEDSKNRLLWQRAPGVLESIDFAGGVAAATTWTTTAYDYDGDGDRDLYVANDTLAADFGFQVTEIDERRAVDQLLRNDGVDTQGVPVFTDVAAEAGLDAPRSSMGGQLLDIDGDGHLELFVPDYGANKLFAATADGGYRDIAEQVGVRASHRGDLGCDTDSDQLRCLLLSWGSAYADFDGDGARDLLLVNGPVRFSDPPPPQLFFAGESEGRLRERALLVGCAEGHGLVAADFDRDGDLDVVISVREGAFRLYENRSQDTGFWLSIQLQGTVGNRDARGALVTAQLADGTRIREVVGAGGVAYSARPTEVFVSGGEQPIHEVHVYWPSGVTSSVTVAPGQTALELREPFHAILKPPSTGSTAPVM